MAAPIGAFGHLRMEIQIGSPFMRALPIFAVAMVFCLVGYDRPNAATTTAGNTQQPSTTSGSSTGATLPTLAPMLAKVSPAVVTISVQGTVQVEQNPLFQDPLFRQFFGVPDNQNSGSAPTERFRAMGSGVILDAANGYVVTNNHVVDRADKILVTLKDRRQVSAKLVGADAQTDVAVLKISADHLASLPIGSSKELQVGDYVVAIGNPFGVGQTATFGIVSALGRAGLGIEGYEDFIQTDASINPGNSGGALVDMAGRLIGINTAIVSGSGGNVGVGFAIPIDLVKTIADQLIAHGSISRGELGVAIQDVTPAIAQAMGLKNSVGALVSQVVPNSAAAKAGIKEADVITALNGEPVTDSSKLRNAIGQKNPGTTVRLTLLRDGKELNVTATLNPLRAAETKAPPQTPEEKPLSGMKLGAIPQDNPHYGKQKGVYVMQVEPGSAADEAGIREGDIIISADRVVVSTPSELAQILLKQKKGTPLLLLVERGDSTVYVALG